MRSLTIACIASLGILLGGALPATANHDAFVIGETYNVRMTGCITKGLADIVVEAAKKEGTGYPAYQVGEQYGVCGTTIGLTRFLEAYEEYQESTNASHPTVWYVRYEVQMKKGSWESFWGFTVLQPSEEVTTPIAPSRCDPMDGCI